MQGTTINEIRVKTQASWRTSIMRNLETKKQKGQRSLLYETVLSFSLLFHGHKVSHYGRTTISCSKVNPRKLASASFLGFSVVLFLVLKLRIDISAYDLPGSSSAFSPGIVRSSHQNPRVINRGDRTDPTRKFQLGPATTLCMRTLEWKELT